MSWYSVSVWDNTSNMQMMKPNNLSSSLTSVAYSGPALVGGHQYRYDISAGIDSNSSMTEGTFTFAGVRLVLS